MSYIPSYAPPPTVGNDPTTSSPTTQSLVIPLLPFEKYIVAHAVFSVIGFLGLLPLGALLARYTRTFSPKWFKAHWIVQFAIGAPPLRFPLLPRIKDTSLPLPCNAA